MTGGCKRFAPIASLVALAGVLALPALHFEADHILSGVFASGPDATLERSHEHSDADAECRWCLVRAQTRCLIEAPSVALRLAFRDSISLPTDTAMVRCATPSLGAGDPRAPPRFS